MKKYEINDPTRIFNMDESGFSVRGMKIIGFKCILKKGTLENTRETTFRGILDKLTVKLVISAVGYVLSTLVILLGKMARYQKRVLGQ